jgi:hypothetical protein
VVLRALRRKFLRAPLHNRDPLQPNYCDFSLPGLCCLLENTRHIDSEGFVARRSIQLSYGRAGINDLRVFRPFGFAYALHNQQTQEISRPEFVWATGSICIIEQRTDFVHHKDDEGNVLDGGSNSGSVTVIDGATNSLTRVIDPNANAPGAVAVDSATDRIYVANLLSNNVRVIGEGTFTLSVISAGNGNGAVTSNPAGVDCPTSCFGNFAPGTTVTLTAGPNATSNFTGWSGACSGTGACSVPMNAAASATATFTLQDFSLVPASTKLTLQLMS